jgi:hypothetical protein
MTIGFNSEFTSQHSIGDAESVSFTTLEIDGERFVVYEEPGENEEVWAAVLRELFPNIRWQRNL